MAETVTVRNMRLVNPQGTHLAQGEFHLCGVKRWQRHHAGKRSDGDKERQAGFLNDFQNK